MNNRFDTNAQTWDSNPTTQLLHKAIEKEFDIHIS